MRSYRPEVSNNEDMLDSRDVIARIRELEEEREALDDDLTDKKDRLAEEEGEDDGTPEAEDEQAQARDRVAEAEEALRQWDEDNGDELKALQAFAEEAAGYASDWRHGATLIRDSYFDTFAQQEA